MDVELQKFHTVDLPDEPGCYIFKDKNGKIIYIGKAKSLKKRVNSYFQKKIARFDPQAVLANMLIRSGKLYADERGNTVFLLAGKEKKRS